jgi:hypothetical protein
MDKTWECPLCGNKVMLPQGGWPVSLPADYFNKCKPKEHSAGYECLAFRKEMKARELLEGEELQIRKCQLIMLGCWKVGRRVSPFGTSASPLWCVWPRTGSTNSVIFACKGLLCVSAALRMLSRETNLPTIDANSARVPHLSQRPVEGLVRKPKFGCPLLFCLCERHRSALSFGL